jgi:hypothetical protein
MCAFRHALQAVGCIDDLVGRVVVEDAEMRFVALDLAQILAKRFKVWRGIVADFTSGSYSLRVSSRSPRPAQLVYSMDPQDPH